MRFEGVDCFFEWLFVVVGYDDVVVFVFGGEFFGDFEVDVLVGVCDEDDGGVW